MDDLRAAVAANHCPDCGAAPGVECVAFQGTPEEYSVGPDAVHSVRLEAWRAGNPRTATLRDQVKAFHLKFGHAVEQSPRVPPADVTYFRLRLIAEEFSEVLTACGYNGEAVFDTICDIIDEKPRVDLPAFVDALADLDYVVEGTRLVCGVDGGPIAAEVQQANLSKDAVGDLKKPTKPEGWKPPDIAGELIKQGWVK